MGLNAAGFDEIGNAMSDNTGLTAARPGKNQERPIGCADSIALRRVEIGQNVH